MRESKLKSCALLVRWAALPLAVAAVACGGSKATSEVGDFGVGASQSNAGTGNSLVVGPPASDGGTGSGSGGTGSGAQGSGVYMLPADYTAATLGGWKLGPAIDATAAAGSAGATGSTAGCGTSVLGVVRDFKGMNEPDGHPDFEHFSGSGASLGIVDVDLGSDQKPVYSANGPFIDPKNGQQTTDKAHFDQWYRATPNVNKPYVVYLYFEPNNGVLTFQSNAFFPLDGAGWGNSCSEPDATCKLQPHNFGFTTEVHTQFTYQGNETFTFIGDDDVWVFINHKLAIDLGGLHSQATFKLPLASAATKLGITVGNTYDLDLFHAERHTDASDFRIDTNLAFTNCGTIVDEPPPK